MIDLVAGWLDGLGFAVEVQPLPHHPHKANLVATLERRGYGWIREQYGIEGPAEQPGIRDPMQGILFTAKGQPAAHAVRSAVLAQRETEQSPGR